MQWRSIVIGLLLFRLALNCVLWFTFGLGFYQNFHSQKVDLYGENEKVAFENPSWLNHNLQNGDSKTWSKNVKHTSKNSYLNYFEDGKDEYAQKYNSFPDNLKVKMKDMAKEMFYFGYDNYMKYAFPEDELNPIDCEGRGPDVLNP